MLSGAAHALELVSCRAQDDGHVGAPDGQAPPRRQPAAAIATPPSEYDDLRAVHITADQLACLLGQGAPCVFHHLEELDVQLLDHPPVHFAHLVDADRRDHLGSLPLVRTDEIASSARNTPISSPSPVVTSTLCTWRSANVRAASSATT
jgi:hypothetical protein